MVFTMVLELACPYCYVDYVNISLDATSAAVCKIEEVAGGAYGFTWARPTGVYCIDYRVGS